LTAVPFNRHARPCAQQVGDYRLALLFLMPELG
jgi:hypothetical protein